MGFLRVLRLGRIIARLLRQVLFAELLADRVAGGADRLRRHLHAVGSHIGDQAGRLAADVEAFIEALRDLHGARRREAEPRRRRLLQRRGGEGRAGIALGGLRLDRQRRERRAFEHGADVVGLRLRRHVELLQPLAFEAGEAGLETLGARRAQKGGDLPIILADEFFDLDLAVGDEAQRDRLDAAGRARARQLAPQHRRQREADEIVERAAGEIGIDQRRIDLARIGHRVEHATAW